MLCGSTTLCALTTGTYSIRRAQTALGQEATIEDLSIRNGKLVSSTMQEGLIRDARQYYKTLAIAF